MGRQQAARLALSYLVAALGWIYISDRLTEALPLSAVGHSWFQTVKGAVFVLVTAGILFVLLRRMFAEIEKSQVDLFLTQFVIDHAADPIYWLTPQATFAYVNHAACEALGYSREELLRLNLSDIDPAYQNARWEQAWKALRHFGVLRLETAHRKKDGAMTAVEITAKLVEYKGRVLDIAFARNIDERKAAENRISETQRRLAAVIDVLPGYVFMKDAQGRYVLINRRLAEDFRLDAAEVTGHTDEELFGPEAAALFAVADRRVLQGGEGIHVREEVVRIRGVSRTLTTRKVPLSDDRGHVTGLVGLSLDISDRKEIEEALRRTNDALRRANAELEQFAYAAAHDLREPLRTISLYAQLLERSRGDGRREDAARALHFILKSANRMETLVNDLLAYTQTLSHGERPRTEAAEVAIEARDALKSAVRNSAADLRVGVLPEVAVERVHLRQILENLIANAIQYRDPRKRAEIEVSAQALDGEAVFRVRDNGIGIKPEYHDQIFGLFKRLHGLDVAGNGIGLALCKKIVEHYGGRIWVESAYGEGATFSFTLPLADRQPD